MNILAYVLVYLSFMNVVGLVIMGIDKYKALKDAWRIPEKTLFLISLFGGSVGTWSGMYMFHHKTKHWYFVIGMPVIMLCHIAIALYVYFNLIA
ncbi:Uncharacterized membrane protein YsdA, DUF1294 family [Acetitomaculum ruminis DSM 5522]|uniref:Uncharacterized membrane protein YsdA, DUF1294 family n=1 Tax=Acetitomaculum ruminis DSM 5522 TaxID=1120918 RepID=A0A1I0V1F2_9FIRM|nr:DUF1294 domain-containing protein [Acetitomaculum ruminis]SFA69920.1 Uncharacterized membrane protein YsdA, DUF1294 family [Acetitomaculum ruminis DSM 5522]